MLCGLPVTAVLFQQVHAMAVQALADPSCSTLWLTMPKRLPLDYLLGMFLGYNVQARLKRSSTNLISGYTECMPVGGVP